MRDIPSADDARLGMRAAYLEAVSLVQSPLLATTPVVREALPFVHADSLTLSLAPFVALEHYPFALPRFEDRSHFFAQRRIATSLRPYSRASST